MVTELGSHWRALTSSQGYASANSPVLHFGLGNAHKVERLKITWPRGQTQEFENLSVNKAFVIRQPATGIGVGENVFQHRLFGPLEEGFIDAPSHKENVLDDYAIQPLLPYRPSRLGPGVAAGDVDGDGDADLFIVAS